MRRKNDALFRLTFSAISAGASVAVLWLGAISGLLDLTAVLFAGTLTVMMRTEAGDRLAWAGVAAASVISLLFLPEKLLALGYLAVGGVWPLISRFLPKRGVFMWLTRVGIGAALTAAYFLLIRFVFVGQYDPAEKILYPVIAAGGVILFVMYDRWLAVFERFYILRLRPRLGFDRFRSDRTK